MQAVTRLGKGGNAAEIFTLFTQPMWRVTPSKYIRNYRSTCEFHYYYHVGANNVGLSAGAEHEILCESHTDTHRILMRLDRRPNADYVTERINL
jgi:hypothetical protein